METPDDTRKPAPAAEPPPDAPTLLILGGTGFVGPNLVEAAREAGYKVTLFNRGKTNPHLFPELEKLRGDRDGNLKALEGRTWDAVVDTSGYVPRVVKASADLLAHAVGHYLFVSSVSAYAGFSQRDMDEEAPLAPLTEPGSEDVKKHYGALKVLCEHAVDTTLPGRATIVRPGLIVGPGDPTDRFTYWPARVDRGGEVLAPGDPSANVQFIDVRDLATWMVAALSQSHFGVFNAVGPKEPTSIFDLLTACEKHSSTQSTLTWVHADFLAEKKVAPWTDLPVWVPSEDPEFHGFAHIDGSKAFRKGLETRPIDETVAATLKWWRAQPPERKAKPRAGLTPEREAEVLAAWAKAELKAS